MTSPSHTAAGHSTLAGSRIPAKAAWSRIASLARAEVLLLLRSRLTLLTSVVVPPLAGAGAALSTGQLSSGSSGTTSLAAILLTSFLVMALPFVVYYNLTTTFVARREQLVLKGLLSGEASRREVVLACSIPTVLVFVAQLILAAVAASIWWGLPAPRHALWLALAVIGGILLFVLLAVLSSGLTRNVEAVQWTTTPLLIVSMMLSNGFVPVSFFPPAVVAVAQWTPMYPVVALFQHGWGTVTLTGMTASGAVGDVAQPLVCLILWLVLAALGARRWMRWEPRR